jgi:hypothetical protein
MSIQTLKRKAAALYCRNHSVGPDGFSLNGKLRLKGIGSNLGRSQISTPYRGTEPVGYGGGMRCRVKSNRACGNNNYVRNVVHQCVYTRQTTVKPSVRTAGSYAKSLQCTPIVRPPPAVPAAVLCVVEALQDSSTRVKQLVGQCQK